MWTVGKCVLIECRYRENVSLINIWTVGQCVLI
jgi:hypothetical protein